MITDKEKLSLKKGRNIKLSIIYYPRIYEGLCNVNNEYLYIFFGQKCPNSLSD